MEWGERGRRLGDGRLTICYLQVYDARETRDPATRFRMLRCTRWGQPTYRVLVWRAGEVEGSGKVSFHDLRSSAERILISAKRRFRVRGTHDLETRQHFFSVSGVSCMTSMMWSRISGGRYGFDIKVPVQNLKPPFLALEHHFDIYRLAYDQAVALFGESVREWIWMEVLEVGGH